MSYEAWGEPDDSPFEAAMEAGWIDPTDVSKAMLDVMNERDRQWNDEHFDPAHDDKHDRAELAKAAITYTAQSILIGGGRGVGFPKYEIEEFIAKSGTPPLWPFDAAWWKPTDQRRNLVKAAALLVAEIERLDRAEKAGAKDAQP